jgi:phospholipid/cholesterol/gamma-HCH transport system substrate-binding protein
MKFDANTKAGLTFLVFLLISIVAGALWYFHSVSQFATYQIYTEDSVSGHIADAPIEFHGVDVGKVKTIRLVSPRSVRIVLSIDKNAPVTSASVATIKGVGNTSNSEYRYLYFFVS